MVKHDLAATHSGSAAVPCVSGLCLMLDKGARCSRIYGLDTAVVAGRPVVRGKPSLRGENADRGAR